MKRDMDLVREIMLQLEARPADSTETAVEIDGRLSAEVSAHVRLMENVGLIEGAWFASKYQCGADRLTWDGHEFLEASRDETIWRKAKDIAMKQTGGLTLTALRAALETLVKAAVARALA